MLAVRAASLLPSIWSRGVDRDLFHPGKLLPAGRRDLLRRLRRALVRLGLGVQGLVEDLLGLPDALDGLVDAVLPLRDLRVRPGHQRVAHAHEGFDRETAGGDFDRTVLADQALFAAAIQTHDGPVGLFTTESTREPALRRLGRHRLDQVVGMRGERQRLHLQAGQGERHPQRDPQRQHVFLQPA